MGKGILIIIIIAVVAIIAFSFTEQEDEMVAELDGSLTLDLTGLEPLAQGHYEGWAIVGEEKFSTGKFNVGDSLTFAISDDLTEVAEMIVVTIEPEGDSDDEPSGIVVLSGELSSGRADLAFPVDFSEVAGNYVVATPTDGAGNNEESGLWFLELPPPPSVGLNLPELPEGWKYEGWAVTQDTPLTTGRFSSPDGPDEFDGFSGDQPAPPFPGEDFFVNAPEGISFPVDLTDGASLAVVSVEPDLDGVDPTGDAPFAVKPLVAEIPAGVTPDTNQTMSLNLDSIPSGTAIVEE